MTEQKSLLKAILNKRMLICLFNGFSAGLPLFFIYQFIPAWLRTEEVNLKTIGLFALVGMPYNWKFIWAPALDRYVPPFLGRRRGWILIFQILLFFSMCYIGTINPKENIWLVAYTAAAIAFFSASQDVVLDAYRRELRRTGSWKLNVRQWLQGSRFYTWRIRPYLE